MEPLNPTKNTWLVLLFALMSIFSRAMATTQADVDYMSVFMDVRYDVVDNFIDGTSNSAQRVTLSNTGKRDIRGGNWAIYFYHILGINQPTSDELQRYNYIHYGVNISHVQGMLFKIEPLTSFKTLKPGDKHMINFLGKYWYVSRTDIFPNWFIAASGTIARTIRSTVGESLSFVGYFDKPNQWKRYETENLKDMYDPYTANMRYDIYSVNDLGYAPKQVIPTPVDVKMYESRWVNLGTKDWVVFAGPGSDKLVETAQYVSADLGLKFVEEAPESRFIQFVEKMPEVTVEGKLSLSEEAYELRVQDDTQTVTIVASSPSGAFYAFQSLKSLMSKDGLVPVTIIRDSPRFPYRGMHLDVGRNFHTKHEVFKLLDAMALYKLNKLHFHITEDEGWRLEIPGLQELTELGSKRCFDESEKLCLVPQLGSGPTNQTSGSGFYTVKDYQEILMHAKNRHIEVIPEFDMPGHSRAAIKAMEKRYYKFMQRNNRSEAEHFLLSDLYDRSEYLSVQLFNDNAMNPCMESTFKFVDHLIRSVIEIHRDISPLKVFNFGGDEVAVGAWVNSTKCNIVLTSNDNINDAKDLKEHFLRRVSSISANYGLQLAGWEDGLMDRTSQPYNLTNLRNSQVYALAWDNVWEWGVSTRAHKLANQGYKVVLAHATHLYFDHPYEPDPEERGYYWAPRFIDTRKTFGYMPDDVYANADVTRAGTPFTEKDVCGEDGSKCVPLKKTENIVGMQGHLWTETVRTEEQMDYMIFPRLLALAERAWHKASWESVQNETIRERLRTIDWEDFANTLGYKELARLDNLGIKYRVPPPGAKVEGGKLMWNVEFPGMVVEHSTNGGKSWCEEQETDICGEILLKAKSASGARASRVTRLIHTKC